MARKTGKKAATAAAIAQNVEAPAAERYDAQAEIAKSALGSALIPRSEIMPVIDFIHERMADEEFNKATQNVQFAGERHGGERGMQSVSLDEFQVGAQGQYWDRPGLLNFDSMRAMVESTPILNAIILTRQRQVSRFCRPQLDPSQPGFVIAHIDQNVELTGEHEASIKLLERFVQNCGWEDDPRKRKILKRDTFPAFMAKRIRDSLSMDAAPIETEFKRDRSLGLDGIYAVDGASIRLCTEQGYEGDDEIFALQVLQGNIRTAYSHYDLTYEVRNPRSDVTACGYGFSETEMLIRIVTYLLNTMTFNGSFFDKNAIPRGLLQVVGNYDNNDMAAFRRMWLAMVRGIQNVHNLPVLTSKDTDSKATFTEIGGQLSEMAFGKWMSFLISVACSVYGIAPEEVSMESYTAGKSPLSGDDTEQKITSSNDKGLQPLLSHFETEYTDYIIRCFSPQYCLRFKGLDGDDAAKRFEMRKLVTTVNEGRRDGGWDEIEGELGDAPINPQLQGLWMQLRQEKMQAANEDFGTPPAGNANGEVIGQALPQAGQEAGQTGAAGKPAGGGSDFGSAPEKGAVPADFGKSIDASRFGLSPIYALGA